MSDVAISAAAVISPVGLTAVDACAALRAGLSRRTPFPYFCLPPEDGPAAQALEDEPEPIVAGRVPTLGAELPGPERVRALARDALQRALAEARLSRAELRGTGLVFALPERDAVTAGWRLGEDFAPGLVQRTGVSGWARAAALEGGAAGALRAVDAARAWIEEGAVERCLVVAVDTFLDAPRLAAIDEAWRLMGPRNPDGFLPGEAAAAVLLEPRRAAHQRGQAPLAVLGAASAAQEPHPVLGERASSGAALAAAIRAVVQGAPGAGRFTLCDLNGESYRAHEWGIVQTRLARELGGVETLWHPADGIGEAGAGLGGLLVVMACEAFARGCAPARSALVWAGSDSGVRCALRLDAAA